MELNIYLTENASLSEIINLKDFIDEQSIEGLSETQMNRTAKSEGTMGDGDLLGSVKALIEAASKPLVELVKCLNSYVNNYRTNITIQYKDGKSIVLSHGRSMTPQELQKIVATLQSDNK